MAEIDFTDPPLDLMGSSGLARNMNPVKTINISNWKVSSQDALNIALKDGAQGEIQKNGARHSFSRLHMDGDSLTWTVVYNEGQIFEIDLDATTGALKNRFITGIQG